MPLTLTPIVHASLCHGARWTITDEEELARMVARIALGQSRHVAAILTCIDKKAPSTRADTAAGAITMLTVPVGTDPYHRDGWVFQAISWIAAHRSSSGAIVRAPHNIVAHKGFDGIQLKLDEANENVIAVVIFEDKATDLHRKTVRQDVWPGIRALEEGQRMPELIQETGGILEAHINRFPDLDIDAAVEAIVWEQARYYRVAITTEADHDKDKRRASLFKGFDKVAPGDVLRRQAETISIPNLRNWMSQFSANAVKHIEAWRDDV